MACDTTALAAMLALLVPLAASALVATPAEAPVFPAAIICVEIPGTSARRPCQPWCDKRLVSHVLRYMRLSDSTTGIITRYEWQDIHCTDYLAERREA